MVVSRYLDPIWKSRLSKMTLSSFGLTIFQNADLKSVIQHFMASIHLNFNSDFWKNPADIDQFVFSALLRYSAFC
jgi:hypothetical protein